MRPRATGTNSSGKSRVARKRPGNNREITRNSRKQAIQPGKRIQKVVIWV
jgi:hypothetical protein